MTIDQAELGRRLRVAREAARLTQERVADVVEVSRPAVALIEAGRRAVSGLELERLAFLFGRDMRDFFAEEFAEADALAALFRAEPAIAGEEALADALRRGLQVGRELTHLERLLDVPGRATVVAGYEVPRPGSRWEAIVQGERTAEEERRRLGIGGAPVENLATLLESQGVRTAWVEMDNDISGLSLREPEVGLLVIVNSRHHWLRRRFSYAHEYAHVLLDRDRLGMVSRVSERGELREVRANAFAAALLMPPEGVQGFMASLGKGLVSRPRADVFDEAGSLRVEGREEPGSQDVQPYDVALLAHNFGVSQLASLYRLKNLGVINEPEFERLNSPEQQAMGRRFSNLLEIPERDPEEMRSEFKRRFLGLALEACRRELISRSKLRELADMLAFPLDDLDVAVAEAGIDDGGADALTGGES